jgi:hypothetical protein
MSDNDLIRRGDALKALDWGDIYGRNAQQCIAALPAVTVGVRPLVFEGRNGFWRADDGIGGFYEVTEVYGAFHMCRIVVGVANKLIPYNSQNAAFGAANVEHQRRILAALEPTPAPDADAIRAAVMAGVRIALETPIEQVPAAVNDAILAMIPKAPTEYERKVAQMREDFPNGI